MNKLKFDYPCDLKLWLMYFLPLPFHLCFNKKMNVIFKYLPCLSKKMSL